MGIPGLFKILARHEQRIYIPTFVRSKRLAIDIFGFIHKSKGSLESFITLLSAYLDNAAHIIAVFDGSPSKERSAHLADSRSERESLRKDIQAIREHLDNPLINITVRDRACLSTYVNELERIAWNPSPEYIWKVYDVLKERKVECIIADKGVEADTALIALQDKVDYIVSGDSDLFIHGVKRLLRPNGTYYEKESILNGLGFTEDNWQLFLKISSLLRRSDPEFAFSLIKIYGNEANIMERYGGMFVTIQ